MDERFDKIDERIYIRCCKKVESEIHIELDKKNNRRIQKINTTTEHISKFTNMDMGIMKLKEEVGKFHNLKLENIIFWL